MYGSTRIRNAAFSLVTVLALGFGAAQAFAAPAARPAEAAFYCSPTSCNFNCKQRGAAGGFCEDLGGYQSCACYYF